MQRARPAAARVFGAVYAMLAAFPTAFFVGAFATDVAYARTANLQWQYFSIWLITAGLVIGGFALLAELIAYVADRRMREQGAATWRLLLSLSAWVLSLLNAFVHSRDGWTAVVPEGLILSGLVVAAVGVRGWLEVAQTYRQGAEAAQ